MKISLLILQGLVLCVSCAQQQPLVLDLRGVLNAAHASELATTARLRGEKLRVSGIVERTGLKKQREVRAHYSAYEGNTERIHAQFPYVILAPDDGKPGRAMCFFELYDIDEIAKLAVGEHVEFDAKLQEFLRNDGQEVMVLHCSTIR